MSRRMRIMERIPEVGAAGKRSAIPCISETWGQDEREATALHEWVENAARKKLK